MSKLTGPLFSLRAAGTIGETLTYASWKGVQYVRTRVMPNNPNTANQQEVRGAFRTLNQWWNRAPTLARAPWTAAAVGQPYTDRNALVRDNVPALQGDANMNDFVGSPGAGGAIPPLTMVMTSPGILDLTATFTQPTVPPGWTQSSVVLCVFIDGDPSPEFITTPIADEDNVAPYTVVNIPGLTAVVYQCRGWNVWTAPDGSTRYSIALADQFTPTP